MDVLPYISILVLLFAITLVTEITRLRKEVRKIGRLNVGENIALIISDGICTGITTLAGIDDTFTIEESDIVVAYEKLEILFNDYIKTT